MTKYWLLLLFAPAIALAQPKLLQLAWHDRQGDWLMSMSKEQGTSPQALPSDLETPLGSVWKLFVYSWLVDTHQPETEYRCLGKYPEEIYCCHVGETIDRDQALVRSCGLYFEPARVKLDANIWANYWQQRHAPKWLSDLHQLRPDTHVRVGELLSALAQLPARQQIQPVLLDVVINAADGKAVSALGGRLRVKTWSWDDESVQHLRLGGFAGWLNDGTPVWASVSGTSKTLFASYSSVLGVSLPAQYPQPDDHESDWVTVRMFARYPISKIQHQGDVAHRNVLSGVLKGNYEITFVNGNHLNIESAQGELRVKQTANGPEIIAHLSREEYVARVLQREASSQPAEAAKALAIIIRTYLLQNAERMRNEWEIDDSSATQRVSPLPANRASREIAVWTDDLVLSGGSVTYHLDQQSADKMSWQQAIKQATQGMLYDQILAQSYPRLTLSRWGNSDVACQSLEMGAQWLHQQLPAWRSKLNEQPGYIETSEFAVCQLMSGRPHIDRSHRRIYVRDTYSLQDRLDLTHEYLHLAFSSYPSSQDENYIENLTRNLLLE